MTCEQQFTAPKAQGIDWSQLDWNAAGQVAVATLTFNGTDIPNNTPTALGKTSSGRIIATGLVFGISQIGVAFGSVLAYTGSSPVNCRLTITFNAPLGPADSIQNLVVLLDGNPLVNDNIFGPQPIGVHTFNFTVTGPGSISVNFIHNYNFNAFPTNDFTVALTNV